MVTKSQDYSLAVYPQAEFEQLARRAARRRAAIPKRGHSCATWPPPPTNSIPTGRAGSPCRPTTAATPTSPKTAWSSDRSTTSRSGMRRRGATTSRPMKRTSPRPAMKPSATSSEARARASWPLSEPTLTYFPNVRFAPSGRDLEAGAIPGRSSAWRGPHRRGGVAVAEQGEFGHVPVLLERCVELLAPALTRESPDGRGATLVDATLGAGGHTERFLSQFPACGSSASTGTPPRLRSPAPGWTGSPIGCAPSGPATTRSAQR